MKKILIILKIVISIILLQTLFFKFTAAAESVSIFKQLGVEPWGRIGSGIIELVTAIFLFIPSLELLGALLAASTMLGAILSHIFVLGIAVQGDNGLLFGLACIVLICSLSIIAIKKFTLRK